MKSLYLLILVLLISTVSISQETKKDTLSIEGKFDLIYKTSSSYKEFKVIRKSRFQNLKNDVLDSIRKIDHELQLNNNKNTILKDSLKNVNEVLGILDLDMKLLITKKNSISFLGIQLNKSTYTITVWSIILLLIIALFYFIYQYKNSY
jgi:Mg2+ and Co2+ transporter CorA